MGKKNIWFLSEFPGGPFGIQRIFRRAGRFWDSLNLNDGLLREFSWFKLKSSKHLCNQKIPTSSFRGSEVSAIFLWLFSHFKVLKNPKTLWRGQPLEASVTLRLLSFEAAKKIAVASWLWRLVDVWILKVFLKYCVENGHSSWSWPFISESMCIYIYIHVWIWY